MNCRAAELKAGPKQIVREFRVETPELCARSSRSHRASRYASSMHVTRTSTARRARPLRVARLRADS
jgi:hypothetical protein